MKSILTFAAIAVAISMASTPSAVADEVTSGDLTIAKPMARPNLPNRPTAGYMVIMNHGNKGDMLVSAASPAFKKIELHTVITDGDVMKMQPVEGVEVPAGDKAVLGPGGFHLMLFDAAQRYKDGESFPLTLTFEHAGDVDVTVQVNRRAGTGHAGHGDHSGHGAKKHDTKDDGHGGHKHDGASE